MKKILLFLIFLVAVVGAQAQTFTIGDFKYTVTSIEEYEVSVTRRFSASYYKGDINIPGKIEYGEIEYTVTEIANEAFKGSSNITSVYIPNTIKTIWASAFENCTSLLSVTIPESVTYIHAHTFSNCSSLISVTIPESVTQIEMEAFKGCSSLTTVSLPEDLTDLNWGAFENCTSLKSIKIPKGVNRIENDTFRGCTNLKEIELHDSLFYIDNGAFYHCSSIESIKLPANLMGLGQTGSYHGWSDGNGVFQGCTNLLSIDLPPILMTLGDEAFAQCTSLRKVVIPEHCRDLGSHIFCECINLQEITFPSFLLEIPASILEDCTSITSISIPDRVTILRNSCFRGCLSLKEVKIGPNVTELESKCFRDCYALNEITLPESVKIISWEAFDGHATNALELGGYIKKMTCMSPIPPTITGSYNYFGAAPILYAYGTLCVPKDAYSAYIATPGWNRFYKIETFDPQISTDPNNPDVDPNKEIHLKVISPEQGTVRFVYPHGHTAKFSVHPTDDWNVEAVRLNGEHIHADENGFYSTSPLLDDSELEIVYSKTTTNTATVKTDMNSVKVFCRDSELQIENRPSNELVSLYSANGKLVYSGYSDRIPVDSTLGVIVVQIGAKAYKIVAR